jgi:hypothetical protein
MSEEGWLGTGTLGDSVLHPKTVVL